MSEGLVMKMESERHDEGCRCPECDPEFNEETYASDAERAECDAREHERCGLEAARWL